MCLLQKAPEIFGYCCPWENGTMDTQINLTSFQSVVQLNPREGINGFVIFIAVSTPPTPSQITDCLCCTTAEETFKHVVSVKECESSGKWNVVVVWILDLGRIEFLSRCFFSWGKSMFRRNENSVKSLDWKAAGQLAWIYWQPFARFPKTNHVQWCCSLDV